MTIYLKGSRFVPVGGGTMSGALTIASGTLTASAPALSITQTWDAAVAFTGLFFNATNTSGLTSSKLFDFQVDGTSKHFATAAGNFVSSNFISADNSTVIGGSYGVRLGSAKSLSWTGSDINASGTLFLYQDASDVLAQRRTTTAQTLRVYGTADGSPGSNYQRASLSANGTTGITLAAEGLGTPTANQDITLLPGGTGVVRFGTRTAIGAETVTGYITIKDAGGTTRKLAVVS